MRSDSAGWSAKSPPPPSPTWARISARLWHIVTSGRAYPMRPSSVDAGPVGLEFLSAAVAREDELPRPLLHGRRRPLVAPTEDPEDVPDPVRHVRDLARLPPVLEVVVRELVGQHRVAGVGREAREPPPQQESSVPE